MSMVKTLPPKKALERRIDDLPLTTRTRCALRNNDICFVKDLCSSSEARLLRIPNFGRKSLAEVRAMLDLLGAELTLPYLKGEEMPKPVPPASNDSRDREMYAKRTNGATFRELADEYSISSSRAWQVCERMRRVLKRETALADPAVHPNSIPSEP